MTGTPDLIGTQEAAATVGVDRRYLIRLIERGQLEYVTRLGSKTGAYLFDRAVIEAFAEARRQRRAAERAAEARADEARLARRRVA